MTGSRKVVERLEAVSPKTAGGKLEALWGASGESGPRGAVELEVSPAKMTG